MAENYAAHTRFAYSARCRHRQDKEGVVEESTSGLHGSPSGLPTHTGLYMRHHQGPWCLGVRSLPTITFSNCYFVNAVNRAKEPVHHRDVCIWRHCHQITLQSFDGFSLGGINDPNGHRIGVYQHCLQVIRLTERGGCVRAEAVAVGGPRQGRWEGPRRWLWGDW